MTPDVRTARALTETVASEVRRALRRALDDTDTSTRVLAALLGRDPSLVQGWYETKHAPLYLLWHPKAPASLRVRLLGEAMRAAHAALPKLPLTAATATVLRRLCELVSALGVVLLDGHVDEAERTALRAPMAAAYDAIGRWLALYDAANAPHGSAR